MAFCSLPCWTYFSAALRTFCLLNPKPNAIGTNSSPWSYRGSYEPFLGSIPGKTSAAIPDAVEMAGRTKPIVRLDMANRMVTKGYQKGVYKWVTKGTYGT